SDPFASQVKVAKEDQGMVHTLKQHDTLFTFGECVGSPECDVPVEQFTWLPTRQPIALDLWDQCATAGGNKYTTITTWHNKGKDIEYRGETWYWTKDREFEKFLDLPKRRPLSFQLAATVEAPVKKLLHARGWTQVDSTGISSDFNTYREYIQSARGEFTVARDQYVRPN